jgi:hypothetical protein
MAEDAGRPGRPGKTAARVEADAKRRQKFEHMTTVSADKAKLDRTMPMPQRPAPVPLSLDASPPEFLGGPPEDKNDVPERPAASTQAEPAGDAPPPGERERASGKGRSPRRSSLAPGGGSKTAGPHAGHSSEVARDAGITRRRTSVRSARPNLSLPGPPFTPKRHVMSTTMMLSVSPVPLKNPARTVLPRREHSSTTIPLIPSLFSQDHPARLFTSSVQRMAATA